MIDQRIEVEKIKVSDKALSGVATLPRIRVSNRPLREKVADTLQALGDANEPPVVFARGRLVRVVRNEHRKAVVETFTEASLMGRLSEVADFIRITRDGETQVDPPKVLANVVLSRGSWPVPPLERVVEAPQVRPDGSILTTPGYDSATGLYYSPPDGIQLSPVPEEPTAGDVEIALGLLDETIGQFPFANDASRANMLAALLTPVIRSMVEGSCPIVLLDKPQRGTGASLLAEVISIIATGRAGPFKVAPEKEEEWRKFITATLLEGTSIAILDNVDRPLASSSLSAVLTANTWKDRVLGRSENTIDLPCRTFWVATGNNLTVRGDVARRSVWVRVDAKCARPWERSDFTHPDLVGWVTVNRSRLLRALLLLVRHWIARARPQPASKVVMGGFSAWVRTVGGILTCCGRGDHFLGNAQALHDQVDEEAREWESFLQVLDGEFLGVEFTANQVAAKAKVEGSTLFDALPGDLGEAAKDPKKSLERRLGRALRKRLDVRHGPEGLRVENAGDDEHRGVKKWKVVKD